MVNSANSECLLCGALARGHFVPQPAIYEIHKIPDFLNVAPIILAGKVDLIVFICSLSYRPAATLRSILNFHRESLSI
jgi:hypothetical protein